jgi:small subunit ribosomal protein S8
VSGNIHAVSFAAGPEPYIASLRYAAFVFERWLTKEKYRELRKPVGKLRNITVNCNLKRHTRFDIMSLSDPIADMLTRIRNAVRVNKEQVNVKASKICEGVAAVLKKEGYILDYDRIDDGNQGILRVMLKYDQEGHSIINEITRASKPGRRVYSSVEKLPRVLAGMGIAIVSTSKGVMSDINCRQNNIGGEILCTVS